MHSQPVLKLDESRLHAYDPQDPVVLGSLWSAFSKASHLLEDGERLRNLSWRLYSRETLRFNPQRRSVRSGSDSSTASSTFSTAAASSQATEPDLSRSVSSASSDDALVDSKCCQPEERHFTPADFQNLVHSIKHKQILKPTPPPSTSRQCTRSCSRTPHQAQEPEQQAESNTDASATSKAFTPPPATTESSTSTVATATDSFGSVVPASETSVSSGSSGSQHSVVRGFTPGTGVTSYTSKTQLAPAPAPTPILKKSPHANGGPATKKASMFMLGGSSGEDEESFRDRMSPPGARGSRTSDGSRKQTSFKEEVLVMRNQSNSDWESDSDSAAVESAIEDDDDEWEDDESEPKDDDSKKEMKFYRVDSKANLTSRRSALTLNIEEQRSGRNTNSNSTPTLRRSRTSTPNGPSIPASPTEGSAIAMASKMQASKPIITTTSNMQPNPAVASPRTTRRNMLSGELSESLRRNMLSERQQQKGAMHMTNIRRANTASDVSRLSRVAETGEPTRVNIEGTSIPTDTTSRNINWNHYFDNGVGEFHQAGW